MKTITLTRLTLRNFKGCRALTLTLNGKNADVYGKNGTGKTTLYDAFTWLLFGKDSRGNAPGAKDFQIKPLSEDGTVQDHSAVTEVEAELSVSGQPLTLKRTYFELWSRKRGRGEATFDGHSSDFFVDGVPMRKNEYEKAIAELADEATFRMLTDVTWFCGQETEQNRRAALFDLIGGVSEADVLASDPAFRPLEADLKGKAVEEYRKGLLARRKALNTKRNTIPARLDECRRTVGEYSKVDFATLRVQRATLQEERDAARSALDAARTGTEYTNARRHLQVLRDRLTALEQQNQLHRDRQQDAGAVERLQKEDKELTRQYYRLDMEGKELTTEAARLEQKVEQYRGEWRKASAEQFEETSCPTCGQSLPQKQLAAAKKRFKARKRQRQDDVVALAEEYKARQAQNSASQQRVRGQLDDVRQRREALRAELARMQAQQVTDLPDYAAQRAELTEQIDFENNLLTKATAQGRDAIEVAEERFRRAEQALGDLDGLLAGEQVLSTAKARMTELNAKARAAAEEQERVDTMLDLCDRFTAAKAGLIDQRVNGLFRLVKWKLSDVQVNGGVVDCCRATIGGVAYGAANDGARVKAGIDVIETMSRARGLRVPLFVDRAESVTDLPEPDTQVIRLIVSEEDEEMRSELV